MTPSVPHLRELTTDSPYPGPDSFTEQNHPFFKGRDLDIQRVSSFVEQSSGVLLFGQSGLGKTSLLQAGLFPLWRLEQLLPLRVRFTFGGKDNLLEQVRARLREAIAPPGPQAVAEGRTEPELDAAPPDEGADLWQYFHDTGFWDASGQPVTPVLVLDQFEEVFTRGQAPERDALMTALGDLIENRIPKALRPDVVSERVSVTALFSQPRVKVVIAMREDYLAHFDDYKALLPSLASSRYRLPPLQRDAAVDAAHEPAPGFLPRDVAEYLVSTVADKERFADVTHVEPALLAVFCFQLHKKNGGQPLDHKQIDDAKGNILEDFYNDSLKVVLDEQQREKARAWIEEHLLTADGKRKPAPADDATTRGLETELEALVKARLLRRESRQGGDLFEIIHDRLTEPIARSRGLAKEKREKRDAELAKEQANREKVAAQNAFKTAEQARMAAEKGRRLTQIIGGLIFLLVAVVVGAGVSFWRSRDLDRRKQAEARARDDHDLAERLLGQARAAAERRRWQEVAPALDGAFRAVDDARQLSSAYGFKPPPPPALAMLLADRLLASTRGELTVTETPDGVVQIVLSDDGGGGAALTRAGRIMLFDVTRWRSWPADPPESDAGKDDPPKADVENTDTFKGVIQQIFLSGDGSTLLGAGKNGAWGVWRTIDGQRQGGFRTTLDHARATLDEHGGRVLLEHVDPDDESERAFVVDLDDRGRLASFVRLEAAHSGEDEGYPQRWTTDRERARRLSSDGETVVQLSTSAPWQSQTTRIQAWSAVRGDLILDQVLEFPAAGWALLADGVSVVMMAQNGEIHVGRISGPTLDWLDDWHPWGGAAGSTSHRFPGAQSIAANPASPRGFSFLHGQMVYQWDASLEGRDNPVQETLTGNANAATVAPGGGALLARDEDELRLHAGAEGRPLTSVPMEGARTVDFWQGYRTSPRTTVRVSGDWLTVVSAGNAASSDSVVRQLRWSLGGDAPALDRILQGPLPPPKPELEVAPPEDFARRPLRPFYRGAGEREVGADGDTFVVEGQQSVWWFRAQVRGASPSVGAMTSWVKPDREAAAVALRGGSLAVLGADGRLWVGKPEKGPDKTRDTHSGAPFFGEPLLRVGTSGRWVAFTTSGSEVRVCDSAGDKLSCSRGTRVQGKDEGGRPRDTKITALEISNDGPTSATVIAGDAQGGLHVFRAENKESSRSQTPSKREPPIDLEEQPLMDTPHQKAVEQLAWGPVLRGRTSLASGAGDGSVAVWTLEGDKLERLPGLGGLRMDAGVTALVFAFEDIGARLACGDEQGVVRVWKLDLTKPETASETLDRTFRGHESAVRAISLEHGGHRALSVDQRRNALLWDVSSGTQHRRYESVLLARFLAEDTTKEEKPGEPLDGEPPRQQDKHILTIHADGAARVWNLGAGSQSVQASTWGLFAGDRRLWTGKDLEIRCWRDGEACDAEERPRAGWDGAMSVAAGNRAIVVSPDGDLRMWEGNEELGGKLSLEVGAHVRAVGADERSLLVLVDTNGKLTRREYEWGEWSRPLRPVLALQPECSTTHERSLFAWGGPAGKVRLVEMSRRGCAHGWDERGNVWFQSSNAAWTADTTEEVSAVALSPRADRLVVGTVAGTVSVSELVASAKDAAETKWHLRLLRRAGQHENEVRAVSFHPDGRFAVTAGTDGQIWLWDTEDGAPVVRLGTHPGPIDWAVFRADGNEVATGGRDGWIRTWSTRTSGLVPGEVLQALHFWLPELSRQPRRQTASTP